MPLSLLDTGSPSKAHPRCHSASTSLPAAERSSKRITAMTHTVIEDNPAWKNVDRMEKVSDQQSPEQGITR
jgi:hypothetical protein